MSYKSITPSKCNALSTFLPSFTYFKWSEKGKKKKNANRAPYKVVIKAIAILLISAAVGSTPGTGGIAIPANIKINPNRVPIIPNEGAYSPIFARALAAFISRRARYCSLFSIIVRISSFGRPSEIIRIPSLILLSLKGMCSGVSSNAFASSPFLAASAKFT